MASENRDRRSALTAEEITNRLYPKPSDLWRREEPAPEPVKQEPEPEPEPVAAVAEAPTETVNEGSERNTSVATVEAPGNGQSTATTGAIGTAVAEPFVAAGAAPSVAAGVADGAGERLVSVISKGSVFDGNYSTDGDVRVEGEVRGDITCKGHVLICDGAAVNAKISATSVSVAGRLSGEVTCNERFEAQPTARITSQISTPRLVIQEGAVVDGQIHMGTPE